MVQEKSSRWKMFLGRNYGCVKHEMMVRELEISISEPRRKVRTKNACRLIACRQLTLLRELKEKDQATAQGLRLKRYFFFTWETIGKF